MDLESSEQKAFDKAQQLLWLKAWKKLGIERGCFDVINTVCDNFLIQLYTKQEKIEALLLKFRMGQGYSTLIHHSASTSYLTRKRNTMKIKSNQPYGFMA